MAKFENLDTDVKASGFVQHDDQSIRAWWGRPKYRRGPHFGM